MRSWWGTAGVRSAFLARQLQQLLPCVSEQDLAVQASILQYARRITEAATEGQSAVDCVIAVPPWFGPAQRQALLDAGQVLDRYFVLCLCLFSKLEQAVTLCTTCTAQSAAR